MFRIILLYGIPGAIIVGGPMLWGMLTGQQDQSNGAIIGYTTMLVALTGVFLGVKHYRDRDLGGVIKFLPALGVGLAISAVASLGWVIAWEISLAITKFDFGAMYSQMMIESAKAEGASAVKLAQVAKDGQAFAVMYANPLFRMGMTFIEMFPIGIVISLVSAALLRNSRFLPAQAGA
ncbi:MAG: DUF4199 domain-containing protein [Hyphomonadaceae bacterium]